ncbi:MAG: hypothetical protein JL50_00070 [Peptococcaceae bacterium BICA1-7]|nr:MAG: hypothetical protein JL50_00070 [Peptococcaceae bacterium BICA1-7]HBV98221.1 hypothetical protein [Desulfotomaculum sp.]
MDIPLWVMLPYGLIEKIVLFYFICRITKTRINIKGLLAASSVALVSNLAVREIWSFNYYILIFFNVIVTALLIWIVTGNSKPTVVIATALAIAVILVIEYPAVIIGEKLLEQFHRPLLIWIVTGTPHILVLLAAALVFGKVGIAHDQTEA